MERVIIKEKNSHALGFSVLVYSKVKTITSIKKIPQMRYFFVKKDIKLVFFVIFLLCQQSSVNI